MSVWRRFLRWRSVVGRVAPKAEVVENEKVGQEVDPQACSQVPSAWPPAEVGEQAARLGVQLPEALLAGKGRRLKALPIGLGRGRCGGSSSRPST